MTAKKTVFTLREYLNIYPDGNVMNCFRKYQGYYPFEMDGWSEEKCRSYLRQSQKFILEALKTAGNNDNMECVQKIYDLVSDTYNTDP